MSKIRHQVPVDDYLRIQKRFAHLFGKQPDTATLARKIEVEDTGGEGGDGHGESQGQAGCAGLDDELLLRQPHHQQQPASTQSIFASAVAPFMKPKSKNPRERRDPRRSETAVAPRPAPPRRQPDAPSNKSAIFGVLPVLEALRADNRRVDKVLIAEGGHEKRFSEIIDLCRARSIAWSRVPRDNFVKHLEPGVNHQGVMAFTASADYVDVDSILDASAVPLIVVLDGVEDPRNLGAILRAVECAGADGVILPERRAVGLTDTVAKSSAGAIEYVKVSKVSNLNRLIEELKSRNIWVVGTSVNTEMRYTDWDWTRPSALE